MRADVRADLDDELSGPEQAPKQVCLALRELAILVHRPADVDVVDVMKHHAVAALLETIELGKRRHGVAPSQDWPERRQGRTGG
jgi:hypothetical protein